MSEDQYWAKRAFDRHDQMHEDLQKASLDAGRDALRSALLLNGGACIALLGFLASIAAKDAPRSALMLITPAKTGLAWFAAGAFLAVVSAGLTYLSNSCYAASFAQDDKKFTHPYIFENEKSDALYKRAGNFQLSVIFSIFLSYCCFLTGLTLIILKF